MPAEMQSALEAMQPQGAELEARLQYEMASQQILQQNEFLTSILESLSHPFYVVDANDFTIQMANSAAREAGLEISGTCYSLSHGLCEPCGGQNHPCPVKEIKQTGKPISVEHVHYGPEGTAHYVEVRGYPLFDDQGNVARVIEYTFDITERRRIEEAYRQSEQRYLQLLEAMQEGVWVIDHDESTTFVTPKMAGMLGYSAEEMMGKPLRGFVDERDVEICRRHLKGGPQDIAGHVDSRFVRKDGSRLYAQLAASPFTDDQGKFLGAVVGIQDITSRRLAELALRKSEALLKETQRLAGVGGWELDLVTGQLTWTEEIYAMVEVSPDFELTLETALNFYDPRDRLAVEQAIQAAIEIAEPWDLELRLHSATGKLRWIRAIGKAERWDGRVTRLSGTVQDVTERRLTAGALREAKEAAEQARNEEKERRREAERRREIAERLAEVMAALNSNEPLNRTLAYIASQARHLLKSQMVAIYRLDAASEGFVPMIVQGMSGEVSPKDGASPAYQALWNAVAERQTVRVMGLPPGDPQPHQQPLDGARDQFLTGNGHGPQAAVTLTAVPILVKDEVYGAMLLRHDEPSKLLPDEMDIVVPFANLVALAVENSRLLEQAKETAVTAERQRLARELHDSVTQNLFTASLVAEVVPQIWRKDPEEAMLGLEKLRHLTRGALAEMRAMLLELRPEALRHSKLQDLVRQLIDGVIGRAELTVTPCLNPIPSLPLPVHIAFYRIAQEALQNVVKHSGATQVTVCLEASPPLARTPGVEPPTQVRLEVSDDGLGFDPGSTQPAGLGLRIMRERAESIGAQLTVASSPGQGTQVTLLWPAGPQNLPLPTHESSEASAEEQTG